jgi:hypothetical protein
LPTNPHREHDTVTASWKERLGRHVWDILTIDLRALALTRIGFGLLILWDVSVRFADISALYSDEGLVPRASQGRPRLPLLALYFLRGDVTYVQALFVLTAIAAMLLTLGYRTRIANAACWILLGALHHRNGMVLQAGDHLLHNLLLWLLLMPAGARLSLDARRAPTNHTSVTGLACLPLFAQLVLLYFVTGTTKAHHPNWLAGEAIYNALSADHFVTRFGLWLYPHWYLLKVLTYGTLLLEVLGPLLLLVSPSRHPRARFFLVMSFVGFHAGIATTMRLGMFSFVCVAAWLFALPTGSIDRLARMWRSRPDGMGPARASGRAVARVAAVLCGYLIVATMVQDRMPKGKLKDVLLFPVDVLSLEEQWGMFVKPRTHSGWLVTAAVTTRGKDIDLVSGGPVTWERPPLVIDTFPNQRWRKFLTSLNGKGNRKHGEAYLQFLCRQRAADPDPPVDARLVYVKHKVGARYDHGPTEKEEIAKVRCGPQDGRSD